MYARKAALTRIAVLARELGEPEHLPTRAPGDLERFPWDAEVPLAYAGTIAAKLERERSLPGETVDELRRQLTRALRLCDTLARDGRWAASRRRVARAAALPGQAVPPPARS